MDRVILSFLGTGKYEAVRYRVGQQTTPPTKLSAAAIASLFPDYRSVILTTVQAYAKNWPLVEESFAELGLATPERVEIPSGRSELEIWQTIETLVEAVPKKATAILDITHGFRTQPLLVFAAMGLLEEMEQAETARILYCAFEARGENGVAPVFDLSPLLALSTWSRALADLRRYGYATPLRRLLRAIAARAHRDGREHKPTGLVGLADTLEEMAQALAVLRPLQAHAAAGQLKRRIKKAEEDLQALPELRPLALFLKSSFTRYLQIGQPEELFSQSGMQSLAQMIRLYLELDQYPQAITLAREALVTLRTLDHGTDPLSSKARQAAESQINAAAVILQSGGHPGSDSIVRYAELWNQLADLRNDVDHAGFRKSARNADAVRKQAEKMCKQVAEWLEKNAHT